MHCEQCSKPLIKHQKKYCSRSCAAIVNNSKYKKRELYPNKFCICGNRKASRAKICIVCLNNIRNNKSLRDVATPYKGSLKWDNVRKQARLLMIKWAIKKKCNKCGWDKHVEVNHKIRICDFPLTTLVSVVNSPENLEYLCPNCHWEFENKTQKAH